MSLDVSLEDSSRVRITDDSEGRIYVRESGATREVTRAEWDAMHPGREPVTFVAAEPSCVYSANITHNLGRMASAAGIYEPLWRPEEIGATHAADLIEPLAAGLHKLATERDEMETHNPENGWGDYAGLFSFVQDYLAACRENPTATVRVWR